MGICKDTYLRSRTTVLQLHRLQVLHTCKIHSLKCRRFLFTDKTDALEYKTCPWQVLIKSLLCPTAKYLEAVLITDCQVAAHKQNRQEEFDSYRLKHLQFGSGSILPNTFAHAMLWGEETPYLFLLETLEVKILVANLLFPAQWAERKQQLAHCAFSTAARCSSTCVILQDMLQHEPGLTGLWSRPTQQILGMLMNSGKAGDLSYFWLGMF